MSEAKHTPGPWVLIECGSVEGSAVATIEPTPETMEVPNYWTVATTNLHRDEWQANARLIAAAPDLLEAGERLYQEIGNYQFARERLVNGDLPRSLVDAAEAWCAASRKATAS